MKLNGNFLTEKGGLKSAARTTILANIASNLAILGTAEPVGDKHNVYSLPVYDSEGNTAYVNIDLSVSTIHPSERKVPEKKAKETNAAELFEIVE